MSCVERAEVRAARAYAIAAMSAHDLLEVVEIEESSGLSRWGWESYHAELARPEAIMLVARSDAPDATGRRVLGFVAARHAAGELHINNIGVRAESRRQGAGKVLLGAALSAGRRMGARTSVLEVRAGNEAAQELYRRFKFAVVGRRKNYYREPPEDALIMTAALDPSA